MLHINAEENSMLRFPPPDTLSTEENAVREIVVTDRRNRRITLRKPGLLAFYRLIDVLGDNANNPMYVVIVAPLLFVQEIDGEPVPTPCSKNDLDQLLDHLESDGINAVVHGLKEHFGSDQLEISSNS